MREDEDDVWRSIVENYGERPQVDDPPPLPPDAEPFAAYLQGPATSGRPDDLDQPPGQHAEQPERSEPAEEPGQPGEERFVPPDPPPLPRPPRDRLAAWLGVFGAPAVLLVCLVLGISLPQLLSYALVAAFVGGFLYLVWQMPRGPRDPWDDGAQV